jgi:hypothetical protein
MKPDGASPGIADVSLNDAINFILKNESDFSQLYFSSMNRYSQPSYSQQQPYQKSYDYPPPNDLYYQPQQIQKPVIFSNDQYLNQPLFNDQSYQKPQLHSNDIYYPQQVQSNSQTPELQNILLNLLTTIKDENHSNDSKKNSGEISSNVLGLLNSLSNVNKK